MNNTPKRITEEQARIAVDALRVLASSALTPVDKVAGEPIYGPGEAQKVLGPAKILHMYITQMEQENIPDHAFKSCTCDSYAKTIIRLKEVINELLRWTHGDNGGPADWARIVAHRELEKTKDYHD